MPPLPVLLLLLLPGRRLRTSEPVIRGPIEPRVMERFWETHEETARACVTERVEVMLIIDANCRVVRVGGSACLDEALAEAQLPTPYCGCGMAYVEQELW